MIMVRIGFSTLLLAGVLLGTQAKAEEVVIGDDKTSNLAISVYNSNLAFVREVRAVPLVQGENVFAFEGVAKELRPETVRIKADNISVMEQNYDFNLINQNNMLQEYVGKEVKTALFNPQTGQTVYDKAMLVNANFGQPVLQFSHGIEANFPGRVIFEQVPKHLRRKPTMVVTLKSPQGGMMPIQIAYLTRGITWKADYIADVKTDDTLALNGWITLTNNSGVDYRDALVQVMAGKVNVEEVARNYAAPMMTKGMGLSVMSSAESAMPEMEAMGAADYYLYTLPNRTTIKDMQSKQVILLSKDNVKFEKKYVQNSTLPMYRHVQVTDLQKVNPDIVFKVLNKPEHNLGLPLPAGTVRFYENDSKNNAQFLGESRLEQLAVGEDAELKLGKSFDISSKSRIVNVVSISKEISEVEAEITFKNGKSESVTVEFLQNFSSRFEILAESLKSQKKDSSTLKWEVSIPAKGETVLTFKVRLTNN